MTRQALGAHLEAVKRKEGNLKLGTRLCPRGDMKVDLGFG